MDPGKRILCICPIGIGNFLLLTPALRRLKGARPSARVAVLCLKPAIARLAERYPYIDEVISVDAGQSHSLADRAAFILSIFRKFDSSIAFFPSNRAEYNLLPFLAGIRERAGFRYEAYRVRTLSFLNTRLVAVDNSAHDLIQNFTLLKEIGVTMPEQPALDPLPLKEEEKAFADRYLKDHPVREFLIGLHPGSSGEHGMDKKRWPARHFAELARLIGKGKKARFLVFGGPEEALLKAETTRGAGPQAIAAETKSLFETAALIGKCHRFISNDSGLMHIAASLGVRCAGIFGPTSDVRTAPWGPGHLVIRGQGCPVEPCWTIRNVGKREHCRYGDFRCLEELKPETVYSRLEKWLSS